MPDSLLPAPRNPVTPTLDQLIAAGAMARDVGHAAVVEPVQEMGRGLNDLVAGRGVTPDVGAGLFAAMGLMSPMKAGALTKGIRAYHGSPHKFDKFSLDKIGTGEGAQAYGHGLYFAEAEPVAKSYRDALTKWSGAVEVETPYRAGFLDDSPRTHERFFAARFRENKGDLQATLRQLEADAAANPGDATIKKAIEFVNTTGAKFNIREHNPGHMYEVNINARPEQFLDWDRPLIQQPNLAAKLGWTPQEVAQYRSAQAADTDSLLAALTSDQPYRQVDPGLSLSGRPPLTATGGDIVKGNSVFDRASDVHKSAALKERGIPGIKYLDQGSRTQVDDPATVLKNVERAQTEVEKARRSGDAEWLSRAQNDLMAWSKDYDLVTGKAKGTSNYVVFDDKLIDILKRYGIAGMGLSGLVAANQGDWSYQQKQ